MLKRKTNIFVTILFTFVAFMLIGTTNVNAGTTEIVTTEQELRDAIDGRVGTKGTGETDTETTYVKLNNNIALNSSLYFYVSTDLTLDLNGYNIEPAVEKASLNIYYGNNRKDMFTNGSLTIKDSSVEKTGTIKSYDPIYIRGINNDDVGKHFALTIENGNFYANQGNAMFIFSDNTASGKTNKATYDFKINGGNFTLWGNNKKFLYSETLGDSYNINFNFNLDKLTIKGNNAQLVCASKKFKVSDIVSEDSIIKLKNSDNEATLEDRTVCASESSALKNKVGFEYNTIEIIKPYDFEVSDVNLTETYGYTVGTSAPISIRNAGNTDARVIGVYVYSVYGTPGEANTESTYFIIEEGNKTNIASGTIDKTWKIKAKPGLSKGTYTATIVVANNAGNLYKSNVTLTVNPRKLNLKVTGVSDEITYGDTYTPVPAPLTGANPLNKNDYNVTYATKVGRNYIGNTTTKPTDVGEYKVTITVTNPNYDTNTPTATFEIVAKKITPVISGIDSQTYTGGQIAPKVTVTCGSQTLTEGTDYTVGYGMNQNVGSGKVTIKPVSGKNYTFDEQEKLFDICKKSLNDSNVNVILDSTSFELIGDKVTPAPVVKDGGRTLIKDVDYGLSYANNTSAGEATVTVTGIGNYCGTVTKSFTITAASTTEKARQVIVFADRSITKTYGDSNFTKPVSVTVGDGTITYTSSNSDVATVNEATGEVTIKKAGTTTIKATASETDNYIGAQAQYELKVEKKGLSFTATVKDKEFDSYTDATVSSIEFSGLVNGETLTLGTDYTVNAMFISDESGADNVGNDKDVSVTITLNSTDVTSNYSLMNAGNYIAKANITPITMSGDWITLDTTTYEYDGTAKTPNITVSYGMITFTNNTDYTVEYLNNINVGTAKIKVTGKGNYSGEVEREFVITPKSITPTIEDIPAVTYNGSEHTPILVVKCDGITLVEGIDYTVEYTNNLNAGTATASITRISTSNYTFDTTSKTFTINKYVIKDFDIELEYTSTVYNNTPKQPTVIVKANAIDANNYDVTYANNTNVGTASVTVTIKENVDNYTGLATVEFTIVAKEEVTFSSIAPNQKFTYTGARQAPSGIFVIGNKVPSGEIKVRYAGSGDTIYAVSSIPPKDVGTYTVTYKVPDSNSLYKGQVTYNFTIIKAQYKKVTISGPTKFEYTGSAIKPSANGFWNNLMTASGDIEKTDVGNYTIKVSFNDKFNYAWADGSNDDLELYWSITKATPTITITISNLSQTAGSIVEPTYTVSPAVTDGTVKVEYKLSTAEDSTYTETLPTEAGTYNVKVSVTGDKNLEDTSKVETLTITKKTTGGGGGSSSTTTYAITVKENENAEITPNGTVKVEKGADKTFKIKAKEGYEIEDVLVDGKSVGAVSKYTFENVKAKHTLEVKVKKAEEKPTTPEVKETFKDVKKNEWYFEAIEYVAKKGLMNGTGNDEFSPNEATTRGMIVTILYRLEGEPEVEECSFTDVPSGAYYAKAIAWAEKNGIVLGLGDGKFGPDDEITREQLAAIMYRYSMYKKYSTSVGEDTNILSYNDIQDLADYAFQAMQYACGEGLISGMGDGNLNPKGNATRAQLATILMRYCEKYME